MLSAITSSGSWTKLVTLTDAGTFGECGSGRYPVPVGSREGLPTPATAARFGCLGQGLAACALPVPSGEFPSVMVPRFGPWRFRGTGWLWLTANSARRR